VGSFGSLETRAVIGHRAAYGAWHGEAPSIAKSCPYTAEGVESAVVIVWASVTSITAGTGSFLEALFAATFGARFLFVTDLRATPPASRTFNFTFFAVARLAADLRLTLTFALRRFEPFCASQPLLWPSPSPTEYAIKQSQNRPTITALSDSPQWRFGDFEHTSCAKMASAAQKSGREQAIPVTYQPCRPAARFGRRSASHDRSADGPGGGLSPVAFSHLRASQIPKIKAVDNYRN
jgi:hypothetical protein